MLVIKDVKKAEMFGFRKPDRFAPYWEYRLDVSEKDSNDVNASLIFWESSRRLSVEVTSEEGCHDVVIYGMYETLRSMERTGVIEIVPDEDVAV